jgi:hypothetical protein
LAQVNGSETPAKLARQIVRKLFDEGFSILSSFLTLLLKLNDSTPDLPICCGHQGIDASYRGGTSRIEQRDNV